MRVNLLEYFTTCNRNGQAELVIWQESQDASFGLTRLKSKKHLKKKGISQVLRTSETGTLDGTSGASVDSM